MSKKDYRFRTNLSNAHVISVMKFTVAKNMPYSEIYCSFVSTAFAIFALKLHIQKPSVNRLRHE